MVYKVDRLTRSLADFAKIVEALDGHGASFVSVTQQFNTTSSMGRLTLNVLLSVAQFEREVAGERIRDKIAASKRKGMWMGGNLALGYDVKERQLVVNEVEADIVRLIFRRYLELCCVRALIADLEDRGIVSKVWVSSRGRRQGGQPYSRGALYYLLRNQLYVGRIAHRGMSHAGQHTAIIDQDLWDRVQTTLGSNGTGHGGRSPSAAPSLLVGLLHDDRGHRMSPSYARKGHGRQYRYYVSQAILQGRKAEAGTIGRVSAPAIEDLIERQVCAWLPRAERSGWGQLTQERRRAEVRRLIERVALHADADHITLTAAGQTELTAESDENEYSPDGTIRIDTTSARLNRSRMILPRNGVQYTRPDRAMLKAIVKAHDLRQRLEEGGGDVSLQDLANEDGCTRPYVSSMIRLATRRLISPRQSSMAASRLISRSAIFSSVRSLRTGPSSAKPLASSEPRHIVVRLQRRRPRGITTFSNASHANRDA